MTSTSDQNADRRADRNPPRPPAAPGPGPRRRAPAPPGVCLVGCGWWGGVHALELRRLGPRVRRFFASRSAEQAREFAARFDGEAIPDGLAAALADPRVDAVVLSLPHHLHAGAARAALAAGRHVLVEKPLALTVEDGEELVRAADSARLCLAVAEQYRLSPLVERVRQLIRQNLLGRVSLVNAGVVGTFRPQQGWKNALDTMGGGVLLDVGVHYIDILRYWFGDPELVWAATPPHLHDRFEGEDSIGTLMRFADGPVANLHISWCGVRSPAVANVELVGERGSLELWFRRPFLLHTAPLPGDHWSHRLRRLLPWRLEERARARLPRARSRRLAVPGGDLIGSRALIADFVRAITTGSAPAVSGAEGLGDLRTVLAAYEALRSGAPVRPFRRGAT